MHIDILLLALFCGHFLGDFVFQTDRLAELKEKHIKWMIFHVLSVSVLTWILLGDFSAWWIAGILFLLHFLVDYAKLWFSNRLQNTTDIAGKDTLESDKGENDLNKNQSAERWGFLWYLGDQLLHIFSIICLWYCLTKLNITDHVVNQWQLLLGAEYAKGLLLLTGLAVGISGVGISLKYQMAEFAVGLEDHIKQGLPKGGKTIGILERFLVFMFVLAGKPEAVGFVIAAKSVFRIGELTNKKDKDHAEYIMIGTLRSFTYALAMAFVTKWLIAHV